MRKFILLLFCFISSAHCFSQTFSGQDSTKPVSVKVFTAKDNKLNATQPELTIYPNPAKNKITIQVKNFNPGVASVKVLDIKGKLVKEENRLITNGTEEIIMFLMLNPGIYFLLVTEPGKEARKKLVML